MSYRWKLLGKSLIWCKQWVLDKGVEWKGKGRGIKEGERKTKEKQGKGEREITNAGSSAGSSVDPADGVSRILGCPCTQGVSFTEKFSLLW